MKPPVETKRTTFAGYRTNLLVSMMLVVTAVTSLALLYARGNVAATARSDLEREFRTEFAALRAMQEIRHSALAERCRALARKPRLHAALEDNALDLLYPSARDELLDVMSGPGDSAEPVDSGFRARFYRFLDAHGRLLAPAAPDDVPPLPAEVETHLALSAIPTKAQTGYLFRSGSEAGLVDEIIAMPIFSTETGEPIAALVVGFAPFDPPAASSRTSMARGIWSEGHLHLPALASEDTRTLAGLFTRHLAVANQMQGNLPVEIGGVRMLLFYKQLNPGSSYPPACEIALYPLTKLMTLQRRLSWRFAGAGVLLLLGALGLSQWLAKRLSMPVERLAVDSVANLAGRRRAEAALETTHEELQRSARFSADASHQLKTPVTVLRIGLEELLARERLSVEAREEISGLVHQTFRLNSLIEDLLLLSRMDAGRLQLELGAVDLKQLIDASLDDLGALPDDAGAAVETSLPDHLPVIGERRYTSLILQNLLENARKYNRPNGRISVSARVEPPWVILTIGNTGLPIPPATQEHIFERFHRGAMAENLPGHGLGLNLARQLARLHLGELKLVRSENDWTEFEVRFQLAAPSASTSP